MEAVQPGASSLHLKSGGRRKRLDVQSPAAVLVQPSMRNTASRSQRSCAVSHSSFGGRKRSRRFTHRGRNAPRSGSAPAQTSSMSLIGLESVPTPSTCSSTRTIASARSRRAVVVYTLAAYCATHARTSTPRTSSTSSCCPRSISTHAIGAAGPSFLPSGPVQQSR